MIVMKTSREISRNKNMICSHLRNEISRMVSHCDPAGLIAVGFPETEYFPESCEIAERLTSDKCNNVQALVNDVFDESFGKGNISAIKLLKLGNTVEMWWNIQTQN